jgi:hypothetical protein
MVEAVPYTVDEAALLRRIREEVEAGLHTRRREREHAGKNLDYFNLENEKYIRQRPAEDPQDYSDRPKRTSGMTRRAVELLTDHLYNPGPARRVKSAPAADDWLRCAYRDNHVDTLFQQADRHSTLNGTVFFQAACTGVEARPIKLHLWERQDFEAWPEPGDPTEPFAVCTIHRYDESTTYQIWTRLETLVYRSDKLGKEQTAGGRVATFVGSESGPHGYGVLPFSPFHFEPPTQDLMSFGLGGALRRANATLDVEMSDLAQAVQFYGRPLGFTRNVDKSWRPRMRPGSFTTLPPGKVSAGGPSGPEPEAFYLQAQLDVAGIWADITNFANGTFEEMGVPLSAVRLEQTGVVSGIAIVAEQAPLLTRAKKRQRPALRWEHSLAEVVLAVGGAYYSRPELLAAAADLDLTAVWPEPQIPIPDPARDEIDENRLAMGLTSRVMLVMERSGLDRDGALELIGQVARDEAEVVAIRAKYGPAPVALAELAEAPAAADSATADQTDPRDRTGQLPDDEADDLMRPFR